MVNGKTLKQLQQELENERKKAKKAEERQEIVRELSVLREGKTRKLLRRLGKGSAVLLSKGAKATGQGIRKAEKFARESGAGEGLRDLELASSLSRKVKAPGRILKRTRIPKLRPRRRAPIVRIKKRRSSQITIVKRRPRRRTTRRVQPRDEGGFFGGGFDLDI